MWRSYARVTVGGYGKRLEMVAPGRGRRGVKDADAIAEDSAVVGKAIEVMAVGNKVATIDKTGMGEEEERKGLAMLLGRFLGLGL
ncbi:hypothetical protein OPV22_010078 [Ensete ventricosum]|uniref:Uncharacterized protein n=1 Tax=Ensete ventricosum TaxID=4639 RepID=A0AAV8RK10_ENSVE|nr:hypothetical protein OPV22_010078 [Ensete ventricosum]